MTVLGSLALRGLIAAPSLVLAGIFVAGLFNAASAQASFEINHFETALTTEGDQAATQAGAHPKAFNLDLAFSGGDPREIAIDYPPGLLENPTAVPTCTQAEFVTPRKSAFENSLSGESCPNRTQIGIVTLSSGYGGGETRSFGLFNLTPEPGVPSEVGFNAYGVQYTFASIVKQDGGNYGISLQATDVSQMLALNGLHITIWGVPWGLLNPSELVLDTPTQKIFRETLQHDEQRGNCLNERDPGKGYGEPGALLTIIEPGMNPEVRKELVPGTCSAITSFAESRNAFLTLPDSCEAPLRFHARLLAWQGKATADAITDLPHLAECGSLPFAPDARAALINPRASSPSGYQFRIDVDNAGVTNPALRAPSPVRKAVVNLPDGVSINPSVGSGLDVCTPAQFEAETPSSPPGAGCPEPSKIGDFSVHTPLYSGVLDGSIYLAQPYQNPAGSLIGIYLVAKAPQRGYLVKVFGQLDPDPQSGRLTATFDRLPQLPYSRLEIDFREGQRSPLATPARCGQIFTEADLTPWRDPSLVSHAAIESKIATGLGGGPCPSRVPPFAPAVAGGSLNSQAGAYSPFYLHLSRGDAEQEITSYSAAFPPGLLGKLAGIPTCPDAAIAAAGARSGMEEREAPSCPAASKIGKTSSGFGLGSVLTYAPGNLYLAGPYHGAQVSVVAIDSALVGPFDLGTIIIRSAIRIDPSTAQASIDAGGSDPIPHIVKGIPIHLRDVRIYIDRPEFTVNPTGCDAESLASALNGSGSLFADPADDTRATASGPFQAFNCSSLGFQPRLSLSVRGSTRRARHPSLGVVVRPRAGDANIASAQVTLPPSLFLNQANIKAVCTRPQLAKDACPAKSVYGKAAAYTPLLDQPLTGNAYLVSSTNQLPDLVFALRGEGFAVNLDGRIDSAKDGGLRATFAQAPDAPVSKFSVQIFGGKRGILESSEDLCRTPQRAAARFMGHANRGWVLGPPVGTPCHHSHSKKHKPKGGSSK